jgi:hypothetical protein
VQQRRSLLKAQIAKLFFLANALISGVNVTILYNTFTYTAEKNGI